MDLNPLAGDGGCNGGDRPWLPEREEVELLLRISLFSQDDEHTLRQVWRILKGQTDDYLDVVLGVVAACPPLAGVLMGSVGNDGFGTSAETARQRFRRWLFETCTLPRDPPWLRQLHARPPAPEASANRASAETLPHFRYLIALVYPVVATVRPFLAAGGRSDKEVERMQYALLKSILLQVALLAKLYIETGDW